MKLELKNEKLNKHIEAEAEANFITKEALLKQILVDRYKDSDDASVFNPDSIDDLRKEAEALGKHITKLLNDFCNKYDVTAELIDSEHQYLLSLHPIYKLDVRM